MNRVQPSLYTIIGIVASLALIFYLNSKTDFLLNKFINEMTTILDNPVFRKYKHLYKDSELLTFLDAIKVYQTDNPAGYHELVKHIDNFISLSHTWDSEYNENYDLLKMNKIKILNIFHGFIFTTPHMNYRLKIYYAKLAELEKLLNYHIDKMHTRVVLKNSHEITIRSKFPRRNDIPGYNITDYSSPFNYFIG